MLVGFRGCKVRLGFVFSGRGFWCAGVVDLQVLKRPQHAARHLADHGLGEGGGGRELQQGEVRQRERARNLAGVRPAVQYVRANVCVCECVWGGDEAWVVEFECLFAKIAAPRTRRGGTRYSGA
jgi:hypothetical protein